LSLLIASTKLPIVFCSLNSGICQKVKPSLILNYTRFTVLEEP